MGQGRTELLKLWKVTHANEPQFKPSHSKFKNLLIFSFVKVLLYLQSLATPFSLSPLQAKPCINTSTQNPSPLAISSILTATTRQNQLSLTTGRFLRLLSASLDLVIFAFLFLLILFLCFHYISRFSVSSPILVKAITHTRFLLVLFSF